MLCCNRSYSLPFFFLFASFIRSHVMILLRILAFKFSVPCKFALV